MQVLKFGGTSVANGENINKVVQLVQEALTKGRTILVVSALGGITDILRQAGQLAATGDESYKEKLQIVEHRHLLLRLRPALVGRVGELLVDRLRDLQGVVGMTQLNGNYYYVSSVVGSNVTIADLNHVPINSLGYSAYISGGTASVIYAITSPYAANELAQLKYAQNVNTMVICHPNHPPYILTLVSPTNWTLNPIVFGSTVATPGGVSVSSTLAAGGVNYAYIVTAVDAGGLDELGLGHGLISRTDPSMPAARRGRGARSP